VRVEHRSQGPAPTSRVPVRVRGPVPSLERVVRMRVLSGKGAGVLRRLFSGSVWERGHSSRVDI